LEVFFATQGNGGVSVQLLSDNTQGGYDGADKPDIALNREGVAHVVWEDDGNLDGDGENDVDVVFATTGAFAGDALVVNGNCGNPGNLDQDGYPIRGTSNPVIAVDLNDPNSRTFVAWLAEGGCADGQDRALRWAFTESGQPFSSGTDGSGAYIASAGAEFETARNRNPQIAVHSVPDDVSTQTVSLVWHSDAATRGSGSDTDILLRRYGRSWDGEGDHPAVLVLTETRAGENNDEQSDYKPSIAVDPGGASHVVWEKRADRDDDKDIYYGVSAP
jgi:hypothetical protein